MFLKRRKKSIQEVGGDLYCPASPNEKSDYLSTNKISGFYDCKNCKTCSHVINIPFKDQKPSIMLICGDGTQCYARKTIRDYKKEKPCPILKNILYYSQSSTPDPEPKKGKNFTFLAKSCRLLTG